MKCRVEGCDGQVRTKRLCKMHYQRLWKRGTLQKQVRVPQVKYCAVAGCINKHDSHGYCSNHARRFRSFGHPLADNPYRLRRKSGEGHIKPNGYIIERRDGIPKYQHVWIAEMALGKELPEGAEIHHSDRNPSNNANTNLVICPNAAYHDLLHQRMDALDACGHADWRACTYCKKYSPPSELKIMANGRQPRHKACAATYARNRYRKNKGRHAHAN